MSSKSLSEKERKNPKNRIQFILKETIQSQLYGSEYLIFYVNQQSPEFPTATKYDFKPSGKTVNGLIKTINSENKFNCLKQESCVYRVKIQLSDLDSISFYASVFPNENILAFK